MTVRNLIIKKNPLSRLRAFALTEILIVAMVVAIEAVIEYSNDKSSMQFIDYLLIEAFKVVIILFITLANFIVQLYFWARSSYRISDGKIISTSRFRAKEIKIHDDMRLIPQIGLFGRYLDFGNVIIHRHGVKVFELKDIVDPALNYVLISEIINPKTKKNFLDNLFKEELTELIKNGETQYVEFKTTLGWDVRRGRTDKLIQKAVLKTLASFMNSRGGILLIGVEDSKQVVGLENDIKSLKKKDLDGFQNLLTMMFADEIGAENFSNILIGFDKIENKDVCVIRVKPSKVPIYVKNGNGEEFFIRVGNSTHALSVRAATDYINNHFKSL